MNQIKSNQIKSNQTVIWLIKDDGRKIRISQINGVKIYSNGGVITIYEGMKFNNCHIHMSPDSNLEIGKSSYSINNLKIWLNASQCVIGENFSCWGVEIRCHEPRCNVTIGNDCMASEDILIYPTDVHTIYDENTGKILNLPESIHIADHVWIGRDVKLLKGSSINNNSVIAMGTIVTKSFKEKGIVVAGNPAKVIRKGINWNRSNPSFLANKNSLKNN